MSSDNKRLSDLETAVNPRAVKYAVVWGDERGVLFDGVTYTRQDWERVRAGLAVDPSVELTEIVIDYRSGPIPDAE